MLQNKYINDVVLNDSEKDTQSSFCSTNSLKQTLSSETLSALEELGDVLKSIHKRMVHEGYETKNGETVKKRV